MIVNLGINKHVINYNVCRQSNLKSEISDRPVERIQVIVLLRSPCQPTADTVNVQRDPGVKPFTVMLFVTLDADFELPTTSYLVADFACVHLNFRDRVVPLTYSHCPSIRGAG